MSWKSCITATFATMLVAAVLGCGDDPAGPDPDPDPDPISIAGVYDYSFSFSGTDGGQEVVCQGQGVITITQPDSTFTAQTAADGVVQCDGFEEPIEEPSGIVDIAGEIVDDELVFDFPLIEEELCDAVGTFEGDPVTRLSGTATCVVDPADLGLSGEPVELTGDWEAVPSGG